MNSKANSKYSLSQDECTNGVKVGSFRCLVTPDSQTPFFLNKKKSIRSNIFEFLKTYCRKSDVEAMNLEPKFTFHVVQGDKQIDLREQPQLMQMTQDFACIDIKFYQYSDEERLASYDQDPLINDQYRSNSLSDNQLSCENTQISYIENQRLQVTQDIKASKQPPSSKKVRFIEESNNSLGSMNSVSRNEEVKQLCSTKRLDDSDLRGNFQHQGTFSFQSCPQIQDKSEKTLILHQRQDFSGSINNNQINLISQDDVQSSSHYSSLNPATHSQSMNSIEIPSSVVLPRSRSRSHSRCQNRKVADIHFRNQKEIEFFKGIKYSSFSSQAEFETQVIDQINKYHSTNFYYFHFTDKYVVLRCHICKLFKINFNYNATCNNKDFLNIVYSHTSQPNFNHLRSKHSLKEIRDSGN